MYIPFSVRRWLCIQLSLLLLLSKLAPQLLEVSAGTKVIYHHWKLCCYNLGTIQTLEVPKGSQV